MMTSFKNILVIIRGGGDLGSGVAQKLFSCGFSVLILEEKYPKSVRQKVSFSQAVYDGITVVEGVSAQLATEVNEIYKLLNKGIIPVYIDGEGLLIEQLKPAVVVDAIMAKRNINTHKNMADITIALGPGFIAGKDVFAVIETSRGHNLGRIILDGKASDNTGQPEAVSGYKRERVLWAPKSGIIKTVKDIGETVKEGEVVAYIDDVSVCSKIDGFVRGMLRDGIYIDKGRKIGDIDPRMEERDNCFTISDKSRCIAGSVLEVILRCLYKNVDLHRLKASSKI